MPSKNERHNALRKSRKERLIALLGGKCVRCGVKENLHFDHINKKDKSFDIGSALDTKEDVLLDEAKKCQLLCYECHKEKTREAWDFTYPPSSHGSLWMYKKYKCRCDKCKENMSKYYFAKKLTIKQLDSMAHVFYSLVKIALKQ